MNQGTWIEAVRKRKPALVCLVLAVITAAVYSPVIGHKFVNFDDPDYVTMNPYVQAGLKPVSLAWAFTGVYSSNWHPMTWISHMLDCQLYALQPPGHHATSVLFHAANSILLFLLLRRMTGALWRSAIVAGLFALHPLHVESVAWVAERKDVLSTFFFMLTLLAYVRYAGPSSLPSHPPGTTNHKSRLSYLAALVFFALGLMSKPMLVTLPFVLLLLDFWPLRRITGPQPNAGQAKIDDSSSFAVQASTLVRLVTEKAPFFVLSAASCLITFLAQKSSGAMVPLANTSFESRLTNALVSYGRYLFKTLWPSKLAVFYPYTHLGWNSLLVLSSLALLIAATAVVLSAAKQRPYLTAGWFWFLGTLVPVIGLVQVGKQACADRYTYLPHVGLFILLVWTASDTIARLKWNRPFAAAAATLTLAACIALTSLQLSYWRDTKSLFQHTVAVTTGNFVAHTVLANALVEENKLDEAIEQCRIALRFSDCYPEAFNTLGNIYASQEKYAEAQTNYHRAMECDPSYGDPHHGLGNAYMKQGKFAEAERECREALHRAPMHLPAMFCLAMALHNQGKLDEAAAYYGRILEMNSHLFLAQRYLGNVLVAQGKPDEAIPHFLEALKIRPGDADTHTVLGVALLDNNRVEEATAQFVESIRLQPANAIANYQLALIHQSRKEIAQAIERYRKALEANPSWPEALNNLAWLLAATQKEGLRNGTEAVRLAEQACKLTEYKTAVYVGTLGAAYAEAGRFPQAIDAAEKARQLALAADQKDLAQKNDELLLLYRGGRAFHEAD